MNGFYYYTIAPNQRGYSFKARPDEINQYQASYSAEDIIAIAGSVEINKFHLIGHDWGSGVGWQIASDYPERLLSFTVTATFISIFKGPRRNYKAYKKILSYQT